MEKGKIMLGVLLGAGVGVLAGILFAPRKGKDTLKLIEDSIDKNLDEFFNHSEKVKEKTEKKLDEVVH
ncbi:YtxH domain-containing protein [Fulvivirga sediminis]|uniref:YtxH domain-containing protein n=1 Tax=Fulvivirga sediminis TaxID=2803949 RepID=A0A937K074_9BACT|nr:YtxH domain-containing protein [Fulvivirga sediminis]MBL3657369.1 YtxH domain-containing protein [Fulvivirga sediminis]